MYIIHPNMSDYEYREYPTGIIEFFVKKHDGSSQTFTIDTANARKVLIDGGSMSEYQQYIIGDLINLIHEETNP